MNLIYSFTATLPTLAKGLHVAQFTWLNHGVRKDLRYQFLLTKLNYVMVKKFSYHLHHADSNHVRPWNHGDRYFCL